MKTRALILPGLYDSGPEHWQSYWERADSSLVRVNQRDWELPIGPSGSRLSIER